MRKMLIISAAVLFSALVISAAPPEDFDEGVMISNKWVDNTTWIDANKILMFVTNHGNLGRDLSGYFGYDWGTFYPYMGVENILDGSMTDKPLYAAGIWLGGIDSATVAAPCRKAHASSDPASPSGHR